MCSFEGVDAGGRAGGGEADTEQAERKRSGRGKAERQGKQSQRSGSEARARAKAKQAGVDNRRFPVVMAGGITCSHPEHRS